MLLRALLLAGSALPPVALPPPPAEPGLLFAPRDVPALVARRADPDCAAYYVRTKGIADARIAAAPAAIAALDDDSLAKLAEAAAFLEALGERPPAGGGIAYARYRDLAADAIVAVRPRTPTGLTTGAGTLDPLEDSGRLQSLAEAYDLLRGSGLAPVRDAAVRDRIASWASAFATDLVLPLRRNNHSLKAGAALVTAALALADHGSAGAWLAVGQDYIRDALDAMASPTGWYREGPHYLNYSLNNLAPAAWHVRNRTGVDWFPALRPFVRFAIDARQPDGAAAAFEEGLPCVLPSPALWPAYAGDPIQAESVWAWEASSKNTVNFDNQSLHDPLLFALAALAPPAAAPAVPGGSPTRFLGDDASVSVLRSGWGFAARQATLFAALDHSDLELIDSRHNVRNPLDLTIAGAGELLLPASGGGPLVTRSARRAYYVSATSKNIVLVNDQAPFVMHGSAVELRERLDSHRADGRPGVCDLATAAVSSYAGTTARVSRTVALIAGEVVAVADEVRAAQPSRLALLWHGRGTRVPAPLGATFTLGQAALDLSAVATVPLTAAPAPGWYAPEWGVEEAIDGLRFGADAAEARFLTILEPRPVQDARRPVVDLSSGPVAAALVGPDLVAFGPDAGGVAALGFASDARFLVVKDAAAGGARPAFALASGTALHGPGGRMFQANVPVTAAVEIDPVDGAIEVHLSGDGRGSPVTIEAFGTTVRDVPPGVGVVRIGAWPTGNGPGTATGTGAGTTGGGSGSGGGCAAGRVAPGTMTAPALAALLALLARGGIALGRGRRLAPARVSRYDDSGEAESES